MKTIATLFLRFLAAQIVIYIICAMLSLGTFNFHDWNDTSILVFEFLTLLNIIGFASEPKKDRR